jgi:hypothetical protein
VRAENITNRQLSELAGLCLAHLADNPEDLLRFMDLAGYSADGLRKAVGTSALETGLVDYFASNETLLMALCNNSGVTAERFMAVWNQVNRANEGP